MSRDNLLEQAEKVISDLGSTKSMLEIYYVDEVMCSVRILCIIVTCRLVLDWAQHWSSLLLSQGNYNVLTSAFGVVTIAHYQLAVKVLCVVECYL